MITVAHCAGSFAKVVEKSSGVKPTTFPPMDATTLDLSGLRGADLWYIDLHGEHGNPAWFGDNGVAAMYAGQVAASELHGVNVFASNCFLGDDDSPMMKALFKAGARSVIAAPGKNFSPIDGPLYGAALVGLWVRRLLSIGSTPDNALRTALTRIAVEIEFNRSSGRQDLLDANQDAMEFKVFYK